MKQILPDELVWESGIRVYSNFFPIDMLCELSHAVRTQDERKVTYNTLEIQGPFPDLLDKAARYLVEHTNTPINTCILKRYEPDDRSAAYEFHTDPEEYEDMLVLCSLGGLATLSVIDMNIGQIDIKCTANTVVTFPNNGIPRLHKITPPLNGDRVRPFAFFGHSHP